MFIDKHARHVVPFSTQVLAPGVHTVHAKTKSQVSGYKLTSPLSVKVIVNESGIATPNPVFFHYEKISIMKRFFLSTVNLITILLMITWFALLTSMISNAYNGHFSDLDLWLVNIAHQISLIAPQYHFLDILLFGGTVIILLFSCFQGAKIAYQSARAMFFLNIIVFIISASAKLADVRPKTKSQP